MNAPPSSDGRGYETRDANLRWVLLFAALVALLGFVGLWLSERAFDALEHGMDARQAEPHPLAAPGERPPGPQLQANPPRELREYLAGQREAAESYGWIDPRAGVVRLPQDRALELMLAEGLPSRARAAGDGR